MLMDTPTDVNKSIYTIAYFGTYASGKLLAGERMGFPCTATVPTWFTDSPTTCPIPCWYPALKPTTGAANRALRRLAARTATAQPSSAGTPTARWAWQPPAHFPPVIYYHVPHFRSYLLAHQLWAPVGLP